MDASLERFRIVSTSDSTHIADDYRAERPARVAERVSAGFAIFVLLFTAVSLFAYGTLGHGLIVFLFYCISLLIAAGHFVILSRNREASVAVTILAANLMSVILLADAALIGAYAEMAMLSLGLLIVSLVVLFPLGARGQALASVAALLGYPIALKMGLVPTLPPEFGFLILLSAIALSVLGADFLDRYRLVLFRYASARSALTEENARLLAEANAADRARSEFLAAVSHELRTPLSVVMGYSDLLLEGDMATAEERRDTLQRIRQHAWQMTEIVQAMIELNRFEAGEMRFQIEEISLSDLFDSLRRSLPSAWIKPGVELLWRGASMELRLTSDRYKLEMVLRNLLHNALKYTDYGSVTLTAEYDSVGGRVRFAVTDTGAGIDNEDLPRIFELFRQGGTGTAPHERGVGLGLQIVKRFTETLGGGVEVYSQPSQGTLVVVALPLIPPESVTSKAAPTPASVSSTMIRSTRLS